MLAFYLEWNMNYWIRVNLISKIYKEQFLRKFLVDRINKKSENGKTKILESVKNHSNSFKRLTNKVTCWILLSESLLSLKCDVNGWQRNR